MLWTKDGSDTTSTMSTVGKKIYGDSKINLPSRQKMQFLISASCNQFSTHYVVSGKFPAWSVTWDLFCCCFTKLFG